MKHTAKSTMLLILALTFLLLFGCKESDSSDSADTTGSTPESTGSLLIGGSDAYAIIRPDVSADEVVEASVRLRKAIEAVTGGEVALGTDWVKKGEALPEDAPEILIGETNRTASAKAMESLGDNSFSIAYDGKKLTIAASDDYGITVAVDYFITEYVQNCGGTLSQPADFLYTGRYSYPLTMLLEEKLNHDLVFDYDSGTSASKLAPAPEIFEGEILYLDMVELGMSILARDSLAAFDAQLALTALQGLANREQPSVFLKYRGQDNGNADQWVDGIEADLYWLYIYMGEDQYLSGAQLRTVEWKSGSEFDAVAEVFKARESAFNGLAVWDSDLPATMLAACTVAGVENLIPVRYDENPESVYMLLTERLGYEVKLDLRDKFTGEKGSIIYGTDQPSTGSAKNDVYLWAKINYLDKELTSAEHIALTRDGASYYEDTLGYQAPHNTVVASYDYLIAEKAFFFSLSGTGLGIPEDDPDQPAGTDYDTFNQIMQAQYDRAEGNFYQVSGWPSVSDGESDPTATEWLTTQLLSSYHGVIEMQGGGFSAAGNISLFRHVPAIEAYKQTAQPKNIAYDENRIYMMFYMGDYDSVAWLTNVIPVLWESEGRGKLPLAWGIAGIQDSRAPHIYNYMYQTASDNDFFVATNNGAGYLNPQFLIPENKDANYAGKTIPDGLDAWVKFCTEKYNKFDLGATPFIIPNWLQSLDKNSTLTRVLEAYRAFSPTGFGWYHWSPDGLAGISGTPLSHTLDGSNNLATADQVYENLLGYLTNKDILKKEKNMLLIRQIIVDPNAIYEAVERVKREHPEIDFEVVDVNTFFEFAAKRLG